ncbi:MAG TPA: plastocyanin/azurin family copper-binding protein [Nitrososphaera sp.]|jgi:plastocyanin|nr:plastocyanin/azurin family copper-binding protein [Nitrososphaera sp.]
MLSNNKKKATVATLALMLLSFSVASMIAISAPHSATAQGVTVESGGNATNATTTGGAAGNATNATTTGGAAGNATNATTTGGAAGNATNATTTGATGGSTTVSIVPGSSSLTTDSYAPNPVQVSTGATVTWTNDDAQPHTATSGQNATPDGTFDSGIMAPGATFSHTFTAAGEYPYFCLLHPNMVGTVSVS